MPHEVYDMLKPANGQNFPIVNAIDIKGGIHYATKLDDLYNIKEDKLLRGMLCYVKETNKTYIYKAKAITNPDEDHPLYAYDKEEWQEFCDGKCFTVKGSILSLEVPPDVSTLIIKNDDVEHKPANKGEEINPEVYRFITTIIPYVYGQTIKIINMNEEPISISGTIDTPGKAAVVHKTGKDENNNTIVTKYKLVTSYDYNSDNLLRTSFYQNEDGSIKVFDIDGNGNPITDKDGNPITDKDGNIVFDAKKYNPEGWFLLPSYDKEEGNWDCRERRIKFLRYDGIIKLNKNESITLQHIEGKYWIDIDSNISSKINDIYESSIIIKNEETGETKENEDPNYRLVISSQRKLKTIKLNTNCTLVRVSNKNKEIDNPDPKYRNFDQDYFGNRLPCNNYEEGDIITIIPTVDNCSIQLRNSEDSLIGSFVGEKHQSKIELVKDSINQFVYTKCGEFTGYLLDRDKNKKVLTEDKYVWKKLTSTTVDKPKDVIELDAGILSKTNYKISIYDNTNIVHMESSYANNNFIRRIKGVNEENLNFYPEFLFVNDIGRDGSNNVGDTRIYSKKVTYTDSDKIKVDSEEIYNIDISNTGLSLTSYSNDKYKEYYYTIPRGLCIKFRYNGKTKKWESIEHFFDKTNTYYTNLDDPTTVTINVKDVMIDHTVAAVPEDSITETMLKNEYVQQWIEGYDTVENEKTIHHKKYGRQYFCWFKDVMVDGRTKNVVFDLSGYKGLTWARNSNEARINGYELPSILQISSIVKKPSSKYELFDGQEITFSMIEDVEMTKPVYFSLHFVHANTAFPISYPNSYYRNMFTLQENVGYDTLGKYDPNIILKSNETSSSGMFSTNYAIDSNYKNANLDLPLEVPDVIIRTSADYNNSDFYSTNTPLYNTKRSKLSTITFKYNKDRNLWFECRREISPYDCRKVVSLPLYKDNGNTKYLKKSVCIDPETEVLLVNSEFKNIHSSIIDPNTNTYKIEAAKHFVTIANINLCNFDFLSYFFLTSKSGRFGTYDSFYKNIQDDNKDEFDKFIKTEIAKNIFHSGGSIDVKGTTYSYSDGQKESINRMMKRMHISCLGKKLTVIAINPARLLAFYTSPTYNPSNLTNANNDIFVYSNYGSIMNEKKFSTKAYDPVQALRYVESEILKNEETNDKIKDGSSIFKYQYYNSVIMEDWCWCNSKGLIELKNNKAIDLTLQGTNWVPTSEEYSITNQESINAGDEARAVRWGNSKLILKE